MNETPSPGGAAAAALSGARKRKEPALRGLSRRPLRAHVWDRGASAGGRRSREAAEKIAAAAAARGRRRSGSRRRRSDARRHALQDEDEYGPPVEPPRLLGGGRGFRLSRETATCSRRPAARPPARLAEILRSDSEDEHLPGGPAGPPYDPGRPDQVCRDADVSPDHHSQHAPMALTAPPRPPLVTHVERARAPRTPPYQRCAPRAPPARPRNIPPFLRTLFRHGTATPRGRRQPSLAASTGRVRSIAP